KRHAVFFGEIFHRFGFRPRPVLADAGEVRSSKLLVPPAPNNDKQLTGTSRRPTERAADRRARRLRRLDANEYAVRGGQHPGPPTLQCFEKEVRISNPSDGPALAARALLD